VEGVGAVGFIVC